MDIEDDDDFYAPEEPQVAPADDKDKDKEKEKPAQTSDDLEEGEEEDEGAAMDEDDDSDSDIDIITERKDGTTAAPPPQSKYSDIRNIPQRSTSNDAVTAAPVKAPDSKSHNTALGVPIADKTSAAASKSTIDINANPVYAPAGKPITQVSIDEDLPENEKPWRKPGTDISDYFNYGFDEFTWALYAAKQDSVRGEYSADAFAANNKKMMDEFNNMMMMGGMGGMGGGGGGGSGGGMTGMEGMTPEMQQQMMQQMMQAGMDPSQMDPNQMAAMMGAAQGGQGQNFGGGYGGNQGGFGFDQNMGGGGGGGQGGGRGGFGGRGRGRRWQ